MSCCHLEQDDDQYLKTPSSTAVPEKKLQDTIFKEICVALNKDLMRIGKRIMVLKDIASSLKVISFSLIPSLSDKLCSAKIFSFECCTPNPHNLLIYSTLKTALYIRENSLRDSCFIKTKKSELRLICTTSVIFTTLLKIQYFQSFRRLFLSLKLKTFAKQCT